MPGSTQRSHPPSACTTKWLALPGTVGEAPRAFPSLMPGAWVRWSPEQPAKTLSTSSSSVHGLSSASRAGRWRPKRPTHGQGSKPRDRQSPASRTLPAKRANFVTNNTRSRCASGPHGPGHGTFSRGTTSCGTSFLPAQGVRCDGPHANRRARAPLYAGNSRTAPFSTSAACVSSGSAARSPSPSRLQSPPKQSYAQSARGPTQV